MSSATATATATVPAPAAAPTPAPGAQGRAGWVFLDRDGTINVKPAPGEYVERPEDLRLLPGAGAAVRALNDAGLWTAVVTNQRGVALGRMTLHDLDAVHERLRELLAHEGARVDAIYACPHHADACDCRKPEPGMLLQAKREHPELDFARAAIVGDSLSDAQAGRRLGLTTVLIVEREPYGEPERLARADGRPDRLDLKEIVDYQVADLAGAASVLLSV